MSQKNSELPRKSTDHTATTTENRKKSAARGSDHPELHSARFADHILIPRWIPDELDIGFVHAVYRQDLTLGVVCDGWSHAAARRGQRHFHFHAHATIIFFDQTAVVNQTKVYNVDRNFRIIALTKLIPHVFFRNLAVCGTGRHLS